jgi:hypothetical protein
MRHRNSDDERGERRPESARRVPLDDQQVWGRVQQRKEGVPNNLNVSVRISFARAAEVQRWIGLLRELGWFET